MTRRRLLLIAAVLLPLLFAALLVQHTIAQDSKRPTIDKGFPSSGKCKRCHERAFEEWETSPLSRSIHSPVFRAALDEYFTYSAGKDKALCFRCHAPHINEFPDQVQAFVTQTQSGDPQIDGVGCAQCHLIRKVDRSGHPPVPKYELGKTLYGPYKDAATNLAHLSVESDLFKKSDLCLNCHLTVPAASNLGKSNDLLGGWEQSKAVKAGKECQTCHMPEQVGESANGENKRTVANHTFPGRIGKLRQEAAKLSVSTDVKGDKTTVKVTVQSLVPHNLPTTHPGWARVVLDLVIKGKNLKTVYSEQRVYGRTYADAKGEKTVFDFKAAKVLDDTVLKPEETRVETFTFPTPKDTRSFDVEAALNYAPVSGPAPFLQRIEVESSKGAQDPAFQPIPIVKQTVNVPIAPEG
ncbi:MAG TPA: multiheme c-type cytochrome [Nitrospirales bacterium]|nr:multiheme c-type cytochrome [Nitrospirales bacterium]